MNGSYRNITIWINVIFIFLFIQCDKGGTLTKVAPIPIPTPHTITIHENERVASFILSEQEFDRLSELSKEEWLRALLLFT